MRESADKPLISVVIPVYKVEEYLDQCVGSVLKQTYENIEVILVDDGSPDACPQKCDEYAQLDRRVRVIHQENAGLSGARNTLPPLASTCRACSSSMRHSSTSGGQTASASG